MRKKEKRMKDWERGRKKRRMSEFSLSFGVDDLVFIIPECRAII